MGIDAFNSMADIVGRAEQAPRKILEFTPGDSQGDWDRFVNMRQEPDGSYSHYRRRGGTELVKSVFGTILTQFDFSAFAGGANKDYIAIHTAAGHIYLYEVASHTTDLIFDGVFSTTRQVQFVQNGIYLYIFDYDGGAAKYWDVQRGEGADFNGQLAAHITDGSWTMPSADQVSSIDDLVWRYYSVISILPDGSITFPSRPFPVWADKDEVTASHSPSVQLDISEGPSVSESYLIATRWNSDRREGLQPSTPELPDGPWFIARQLTPYTTSISDSTADNDLIEPVSGLGLPLTGGIPSIFVPNQIQPDTVASISGTLIFGGYTINRPVPEYYSDPENPAGNNIYVDFNGNPLPGSLQLAVAFQYTDQTYSGIIDSGQMLRDGEKGITDGTGAITAEAQTTIVDTGNTPANGTFHIRYPMGEPGEVIVSVDYLAGDGRSVVSAKIASAINSNPDIELIASDVAWDIFFFAKEPGSDPNGNTIQISNTGSHVRADPNIVTMEGGKDATSALTVSGNWMQIQNTNTLIERAWVLAKNGTTYRVLAEIPANDGRLHGALIILPNSANNITNKPAFVAPDIVQTQVALDNYITTSVAFQNIDIRSQQRIADRSKILRVVPETFDIDKTLLRYRLQVFTERNLQIVYLTASGDTYDSDAEILLDDLRVESPEGIRRLLDTTLFQGPDGLYMLRDGITRLADRRAYPVLEEDLRTVVYNPMHGEYWFIFSSNTVFVWDTAEGQTRQFVFDMDGATIRSGLFAFGELYLSAGPHLCRTDDPDLATDLEGAPIVGEMITKHLGTPVSQTKLLEAVVAGQDLDVQLMADLQPARLEGSTQPWTKEFTPDFTGASQPAVMSGASWELHMRAVMPRIKLRVSGTGNGFLAYMLVKYIETQNRGVARGQ